MTFFSKLFGKKKEEFYLTLNMKAKFNVNDRTVLFEEVLSKLFKQVKLGKVTGGGTLIDSNGEPLESDVELCLNKNPEEIKDKLCEFFNMLGLPKNSSLIGDNLNLKLGDLEGLAVYLNGTELPEEVYKTSDVNFVISEITKLLGDKLKYYSFWQGAAETALYFYGNSYNEMKELIKEFIETYPLCQKCRLVQIV